MRRILQSAPIQFPKLNNGITIICDKVHVDDDKKSCHIEFGTKEGICNGGHTYFAIVTMQDKLADDALVHLELVELPEDMTPEVRSSEIAKIARARNNNTRLATRSEADYLGYYDVFKRRLENPAWVSWHEGDSSAIEGAIKSEHFIRSIVSLDPLAFKHPVFHPDGEIHKPAVTGISGIHTQWFTKTEEWKTEKGGRGRPPLMHMSAFGDDLFKLRDMLARSIKEDNLGLRFRKSSLYQQFICGEIKNGRQRALLTDTTAKGMLLPDTFEVMLLGLFRTNVWLHLDANDPDNIPDFVGWYHDPQVLWNKKKKEVLENLLQDFTDLASEPTTFIRARAPYRTDLYMPDPHSPPLPSIVYSVDSGVKYVFAENEATHQILPASADGLVPIPAGGPGPHAKLYKRS